MKRKKNEKNEMIDLFRSRAQKGIKEIYTVIISDGIKIIRL